MRNNYQSWILTTIFSKFTTPSQMAMYLRLSFTQIGVAV